MAGWQVTDEVTDAGSGTELITVAAERTGSVCRCVSSGGTDRSSQEHDREHCPECCEDRFCRGAGELETVRVPDWQRDQYPELQEPLPG
ncbi:hypothetical protein [Streptomyces sp. NPDC020362]|uniref:hypothetical protein n=1 Tax=unclassified Streptomyces TaxID=2593676 RepID=UPI0033C67E86